MCYTEGMKLVINLKLLPSAEQRAALLATLERVNAACDFAAELAWERQVFGQYALHKLAYYEVRSRFMLTAQMAVRAIAKVADAYKLDRKTQRQFRPQGAIAYDSRILRYLSADRASLWTLEGRQTVPFVCGERQRALLPFRKGESDLLYIKGVFYLSAVCDVEEPDLFDPEDVLGVDLGIVQLAVDSDGTAHSGAEVDQQRRIHAHRRRNLQRKGTHAARRKLRRIAGQQQRFQTHTNHVISKTIVQTAKATRRAVALEDLTGISKRVTVRRGQKARLGNWGFFQLRSFIEYKARLSGVPVITVDPRNTSRTCPACGHVAKANRRTQSQFLCVQCGYSGLADHVAAVNIRSLARAAVNRPMFPATA